MRLISFAVSGGARLGCATPVGVLDCNALLRRRNADLGYDPGSAARLAEAQVPADLGDFLAGGAAVRERAAALVAGVLALPEAGRAALRREQILADAGDLVFLPPLAAGSTVFAVGRNYAEHVAEGGGQVPKIPSVFIRLQNSFVGHRQGLVRPWLSTHFDWEVELAVVIGRHIRHATRDTAMNAVAGYTILNEGSVRDYQKAAPHVTAGKNFMGSGSIGPSIVTADEVPDPHAMPMRMWLDGQLMQNASTGDMVHDIAAQIVYITQFTALRPGDLISTGTPAGVGLRQNPPRWLKPGEEVRMEIGNLDPLVNTVVDEPR